VSGRAAETPGTVTAAVPGARVDWFTAQVRGTAPEPPPDGFLVPPGLSEALMEQLREHFTAMDAWYEQAGPVKPLPWRWRAKQKLRDWREQAARLAYRAVAGDWPDDGEDDW
jgi:hypothetical protein